MTPLCAASLMSTPTSIQRLGDDTVLRPTRSERCCAWWVNRSPRAARAILGRLSALFSDRLPTPSELLAAEEGELRSVGLSRQKLSYIRNLAERVEGGTLELDRLADLPDDEAREKLMAVKGVGPWSAGMFLLRELGRPDVLPSGDVGLRKAVQKAYGLASPPTPAEVDLLGEKWRPHRSLADAYLFASLVDATEPKPVEQTPDSPTF